ncbi:MAG: hypothetical protein ACRDRJ_17175 [Streptosporangiaceae bacterium]
MAHGQQSLRATVADRPAFDGAADGPVDATIMAALLRRPAR